VGVRGVASVVGDKVMCIGKERRERAGTQRKQRDVREIEGGRAREDQSRRTTWFVLAGMAWVGWGRSVVVWASELVGWGWSVVVCA